MGEVPTGVGRTALATAWLRAEEHRRPDRLFDDPLAAQFVTAAAHVLPPIDTEPPAGMAGLLDTLRAFLVVRTRVFDEALCAAAGVGCRQLVLLAAGLDCRAFRLAWPEGTRVYELDSPQVLAFKQDVLAHQLAVPRCERYTIAADLTANWADQLFDAGFRPTEPTVWLAEGILLYLTAPVARRLLAQVGELSAPGSRLVLDDARGLGAHLSERLREVPEIAEFIALWKGGPQGCSPAWLADDGWRCRTQNAGDVADLLGRPFPSPLDAFLLTAER